uniref:THO complex subunit 1 n=1 Tax=Globodera rostochiensis TaxID=31243 RepID=A0A914H4G3_GLORO
MEMLKNFTLHDLSKVLQLPDEEFQPSVEPEQRKSLIERFIRSKALKFGGTIPSVVEVNAFVKFVIDAAKQEICSKTITIQVLQDIFDVSTVNCCERLFEIVEDNIDTWKTAFFFDSCKNLVLRMCNDLLKRLSRTVDTTFCGRILILLANFLPFTEKSGLNLTGQFNTLNATTYDREKKEQPFEEVQHNTPIAAAADDDVEVGEIREYRDVTGAISVDYNLYVKFWELQKFFANPNLLFEYNAFKNFHEGLSEILAIFSTNKLERTHTHHKQSEKSPSAPTRMEKNGTSLAAAAAANNDQGGTLPSLRNAKLEPPAEMEMDTSSNDCCPLPVMNNGVTVHDVQVKMEMEIVNDGQGQNDVGTAAAAASDDDDGGPALTCAAAKLDNNSQAAQQHQFFAKYLTSQKLFPLQLADSQFRRYFMLQYLIIANYLLLKVKLKDTFTLTALQEEEVRELSDKCFALLRETHPNGVLFADAVKKVLSRERLWSAWKNEGCPDLITPLLNSQSTTKYAAFKRKALNHFVPGQLDLGNKELSRLWNIQPNNLVACKEMQRKCTPELVQFLEEALDEMDPEQQVDEQYQSVNDETYQWTASRFLLLTSDQYLTCNVQDSSRMPTTTTISTAFFLRKTIQMTAENVPTLKERAEQILSAIKKRENAERARLAAEAKELEKLEKKAAATAAKHVEEDEQQPQQQQQQQRKKDGANTNNGGSARGDEAAMPATKSGRSAAADTAAERKRERGTSGDTATEREKKKGSGDIPAEKEKKRGSARGGETKDTKRAKEQPEEETKRKRRRETEEDTQRKRGGGGSSREADEEIQRKRGREADDETQRKRVRISRDRLIIAISDRSLLEYLEEGYV